MSDVRFTLDLDGIDSVLRLTSYLASHIPHPVSSAHAEVFDKRDAIDLMER